MSTLTRTHPVSSKANFKEAVAAVAKLQDIKELEAIIELAKNAISVQRGRGRSRVGEEQEEIWAVLCGVCKDRNAPALQKDFGALLKRAGAVGTRLRGAMELAKKEVEEATPEGLGKLQRMAFTKLLLRCAWMEAEKLQWWQPNLNGMDYLLRNLSSCLYRQFPGYYRTPIWSSRMTAQIGMGDH